MLYVLNYTHASLEQISVSAANIAYNNRIVTITPTTHAQNVPLDTKHNLKNLISRYRKLIYRKPVA